MIFSFALLLFNVYLIVKCSNNIQKEEFNSNTILDPGITIKKTINYVDGLSLSFNNKTDYISDLIVNIVSIDCKITLYNSSSVEIITFNEEFFSITIKNDSIKNVTFTINALMDIIDGNLRYDYENRNCDLIINSMFKNSSNEPNELFLKESKQTVLLFNENIKEANIIYEIDNNNNDSSFLAFLFLFDKNTTFNITISDSENKLNITKELHKSSYIFFDSNSFKNRSNNNSTLIISINHTDNDNPVLMTFKIIEKNAISFLEKKYLNYGFITSKTTYQYYYMKIFQGEEGEIMLHNKRTNGKLLGLITNNTDINIKNFANKSTNNSLVYDKHTQKLNFRFADTDKCKKGCNLLITYVHENDKIENNDQDEIGYEFTLLVRVWDEMDLSPQIINIPFNEYIFGYFERDSINHHYYSIFIPNDTQKIIIQIVSNNIEGFIGEGKNKLITIIKEKNEDMPINLELSKENVKKLIEFSTENITMINSFISFAFRPKNFLAGIFSFYYFRIFYFKSISETLLLPLDSNVGNICQPQKRDDKFFCQFFLSNNYNELSKNFSLTSSDNINAPIIHYQEDGKIEGNVANYYNVSNKSLKYIFFEFEFKDDGIKNILSTFDKGESDINANIYSSQIYHLNSFNSTFNFTLESKYYSIVFIWINGFGNIEIKKNDTDQDLTINLNNNYESKPIFIPLQNISFFNFFNNENFVFYLKIKYENEFEFEEIYNGLTFHEIATNKKFPLYYYLKINFDEIDIIYRIIDSKNTANDIEAYIIGEDSINKKLNGEFIELTNAKKGVSDSCFKNGLVKINNIDKNDKNSQFILMKIGGMENKMDDNALFIKIISLYKRDTYYILPINEYIVGLLNNETNSIEYLIKDNDKVNSIRLIEFSSNYNDTTLTIRSKNNIEPEFAHGIKKYRINERGDIKVIVKNINKTNKDNKTKDVYFTLRYYYSNKTREYIYSLTESFKIYANSSNDQNTVTITLEFENIKMTQNGTLVKKDTISYSIYGALFDEKEHNDNDEEIKTLTMISLKPKYKAQTTVNNNDSSFYLTFDNMSTTIEDNYIFNMQIKVNVRISPFEEELLVLYRIFFRKYI